MANAMRTSDSESEIKQQNKRYMVKNKHAGALLKAKETHAACRD